MKVIEYIGEVLPDGHISLPDKIREELNLNPHCNMRITITVETSRTLDEAVQLAPHLSTGQAERSEQKGWEVFRLLGQDAIGGKLSDASTKHDKYLYGKNR